jgi:hypothetical protein
MIIIYGYMFRLFKKSSSGHEIIPLTNSQYIRYVSSLWDPIWLYDGCTDKLLFCINSGWGNVSNIKIRRAAGYLELL